MKTKNTILVIIGTLALIILTSCTPTATPTPAPIDTPAQVTEPPVAAEPATQEPVVPEAPIVTDTPIPTSLPLACVTLLTPKNGADLPSTGKVTFSWTPMDEANFYLLNIILPSGEIVTFKTDQTFRDRYMEAFTAGGEYQWQVTAQGADGNKICISETFAFDKSAYQKPNGSGGDGGSGGPPIIPTSDNQ
jgi:hypothetical protein